MVASAESLPQPFHQQTVSLTDLQQSGLPFEETTYLAIGGGLGSFIWVDTLLIHGVNPAQVAVIGFENKPYSRFRRLCRNSQIPDDERLRSDSGGTPDNIWGWPGYAVREIWRDFIRGHWRHAAHLAWQIFTEPVLADPFTPKAGQVLKAIDREAQRIGWAKLWRFGRVRAIRKTSDGRYAVLYSQTTVRPRPLKVMIAKYLHLALGYPRLEFLPDLQKYRQQTGDFQHFINAYEAHDHVYDQLRCRGGAVLLRGRGIVASRIIQRLHQERDHNPNISILHLMRGPRPDGPEYSRTRRPTEHHFDHQHYNFPKSCFGGDFRFVMEQADDSQRAKLIEMWGGTTTARRQEWENIINAGLNEGWYQIRFGRLAGVQPYNGQLISTIHSDHALQSETRLLTSFIIDATGLDTQLEKNPLLHDLLQTYQLPKNGLGNLAVTNSFEIDGLRNGDGRVYAAGIITLGGPFAPVDSFTGLQFAAQQSLENLVALGAQGVRRCNPIRSAAQWLRWVLGVKP